MFLRRPKKEESVSLTLLVLMTFVMIVVGSLEMAGVVSSTSVFPEMYYSAVALYFGRLMNVNNKFFSSQQNSRDEDQKEKKAE